MYSRLFYLKDILKIAFPIILGNIGFIMIGVGDVIVAGRHSTDTLAAISIATAVTNSIMILGIGIIATISAILSNYRGEGKNAEDYFYPSVKFTFILSLIVCIVILAFIPFIDKLGFEQNLIQKIKDYFFITAFASFGGYFHCMAKEYLQAFEIVVFPNLLTIFCIFLNVGLNIVFAFGCGIIPEMGAKGLALASLITRYFMAIVLIIYCFCKFNLKYKTTVINYYKDLLKVGLPASLAIFVEFAGFNIIAIIMGRVSGIYAAAHNLITTMTSVSFMVPLAISNAAAVKVGYSNGAEYWNSLKKYANTAILSSVSFMSLSAIIIGIFAEPIIKLFTNDINLINICVPIAYILCAFQVFDGLQVALSGIYRGIKQTKIVMISNIISYWLIACPLGCLLGLHFKLNLIGFWIALCFSAIILCTIMYAKLIRIFKKLN
jgi:MATE family multidrug resistance protein